MVKRDSVYVGVGVGVGVGASQNKILADVTNLHQQQPKQQVSAENLLKVCYILQKQMYFSCFVFVCLSLASHFTDVCFEFVCQEKEMLVKVLASKE